MKRKPEERKVKTENRSHVTFALASETSAPFGPSAEVNQIPLRAEQTFAKLRSEASKVLRTVSSPQNTLTPFVLFCGSFGVCLFGLLSVWFTTSGGRAKCPTSGTFGKQTLRIPLRDDVCFEPTAAAVLPLRFK
ncbi:MAG: hypothetical protein ACTS4V_01920 [Candidatus Hodgkinia cicadicola]